MTKSQWRVFILFTLPFCAVALAFGMANIANESKTIRVGNVWSDFHNGNKQESFILNK